MPKYLYRLLVFTLLLAAVPVMSIGTVSYFIASRDIEKKVNEGVVQILLQNQMRLEQVLNTVEMAAVQYLNSSVVAGSLYDDLSPEDFQVISGLSRGLYNLQSLTGVADTSLINLEKNWMIGSRGFTSAEAFTDREALNEYARQPQNLFWLASGSGNGKNAGNGAASANRDTIRMVVKLPMIAASATPKALLVIYMSSTELEKYQAQNKQLGDIYVLNRDRVPFLKNPDSASLSDSVVEKLKTAGGTTGYFEQNALAVNYKISPYNNWTYVSVVSIEGITKETKKIAYITWNACLLIFAIIAAAAFYGSRWMYSPIRRLFNKMEQIGGTAGDLTKKDEFAFMEERFNALFSTQTNLQLQLHGQMTQMKEFFLLKLFMGQITDSDFSFKWGTYGFTGRGKALGVIALQIDALQDTRYVESDKELLLFAINNIVGELIPDHRMLGTLLLDQSQVSLLTGDADDPEQLKVYFHQTAELINAKVHELLKLKVSVGISRAFYRYSDAISAYSEAVEALQRRISLGNDIILHYDDIESVSGHRDNAFILLNHLEDYVINALRAGDAASAEEHYDRYVASIMEREVGFNDFQMLMLQLINRIYQLVSEQQGSLYGIVGSNSVVKQFIKLNTVQEITAWFKKKLLSPSLAFMKERVESQYINIAHQMVQIIQEQYEQDISLNSCAAQLKFHPVYLSRVFKKEIGVTFIDYLTDYRMNMAKMWLENTDLKIAKIAERVNYTTATGFIRTFRKLTGMTPGQYRESRAKSK